MPNIRQLLIATSNPGKVFELKEMLSDLPLRLLTLADLSSVTEIEENGRTFDENARLKARGYALQSGMIALADDSGLEIAALDGRPGSLSARYGGDVSFAQKMTTLLAELDETVDQGRVARFVCSIAISGAGGEVLYTSEGVCTGKIAPHPRGCGGFGYDPIFIPDGFDQTFGQLPDTVKQRISHRRRAFEQIIPFLGDFIVI